MPIRKLLIITILICAGHSCLAQYSGFQSLSDHAIGANDVLTFDVDQDGLMDVISSSEDDSKIAWYKQLPSGLFDFQDVFTGISGIPVVLAKGDLDGNGLEDIVYACENNRIVWIDNQGDITSGTHTILTNTLDADELFVEDIDGDLDLDVVFGLVGSGVYWFENTGGGNFTGVQTISGWPRYSTALIDLDNDNDLDLYFSDYSTLRYVENLGAGVFGPIQVLSAYPGLRDLDVFDIDNDSDDDLFLATDAGVQMLENSGGTMLPSVILCVPTNEIGNPISPTDIKLGDVDADGYTDIVVLTGVFNHVFGWFRNDGVGSFGPEVHINSDSTGVPSLDGINSLLLDDLDGNGDLDILFTSTQNGLGFDYSKVGWFKNNGGVYAVPQLFTSQTQTLYDILVADIDGDGSEDIVYTQYDEITWNRNMGDSAFATAQLLSHLDERGGRDLDVADIDNDGDLDLICSTGQTFLDQIFLIENLGGGNFADKALISDTMDGCHSVELADFDGDLDLDIAFASSYMGNSVVGWIENLGAGNFAPAEFLTMGLEGAYTMKLGDLNGDNIQDLVVGATWGVPRISWFACNGNGTFNAQQDIFVKNNWGVNFELVDHDQDGDMDLFSSGSTSDSIRYHENNGSGIFTTSVLNVTGNLLEGNDLDVDGDYDLIVTDASDTKWYENLGSLNFVSGGVIGAVMTELETADINSDGDLDLIAASYSLGKVYYAENFHFSATQIHGRVFIDLNQNLQHDSTDFGLANSMIGSIPQSDFTYTYSDGRYFMNFSDVSAAYEITPQVPDYWEIVTTPDTFDVVITPAFLALDSIDFGMYPDTLVDSLSVALVGGFPRCGTNVNYWIDYTNVGSTILNGYYELTLDPQLTYISADLAPDSINGQSIFWSYDSLWYFQTGLVNIVVEMPDFTSMGDTLVSSTSVHSIDSMGITSHTALDDLEQILVCAYDPNDKSVWPTGVGPEGYISNDQSLEYVVRFQNTGNDTALVVRIKDFLDDDLDWSSMEVVASSHTVQTSIQQDGEVTFLFDNIYLPDSNVNFLGSQGFVMYRIELEDGLPGGTEIVNEANIFFDFNPAVVTNSTLNTIYDCSILITTVSVNDTMLTADQTGVDYQWIDCDNSLPIPGATNQIFNPDTTFNGQYSVVISNEFCADTSTCIQVCFVNTNVTASGATLQSEANSMISTFQWIDCLTGTLVPGEVNQSFTSTANSEYAVIVTQGACFDTSACIPTCVINTNVSVSNFTLQAEADPMISTFQWIDCATGTLLSGEVDQSFTATTNGDYAVIVTEGSCSDTSACNSITTLGLTEFSTTELTTFPNPVEESLTIITEASIISVRIFDTFGQLVQIESEASFSVKDMATGIYFLLIETSEGIAHSRILKK